MTNRALVAVGALSVLLTSCSNVSTLFERQTRVNFYDEAGSAKIAVLSSAPWSAMQKDLQPKFSLSEDAALSKSFPSTVQIDDRFYSSLAAALKLAPPQTSTTSTTSENLSSGILKQSAQTDTKSSPGDLSTVKGPTLLPPGAAGLPGAPMGFTPGVDPMLQYLAATALYQEVQMLNRYVTDALRYPGATAQVVRLQLAIQPSQRNLPYDVYTQISAIPDDVENPRSLGSTPESEAGKSGEKRCKVTTQGREVWDRIEMVPLLVTDNLEGMLASRTAQSIQQFGLSLVAMLQGFGIGADIASTTDKLQRILGREVNSVFTMSRTSHATVTVRLGASATASNQYSMAPRTHNVTLLVLYRPCNLPKMDETKTENISLMARTDFVDTDSGKALPARDEISRLGIVLEAAKNKYRVDFTKGNVYEALRYALRGDWDRYYDTIKTEYDSPKFDNPIKLDQFPVVAAGLWADLISSRLGNQYSWVTIPIKLDPPRSSCWPIAQQAFAEMSSGTTIISLYQGENLDSDIKVWLSSREVSMATPLSLPVSPTSAVDDIVATSFEVANGGSVLTIKFPNLSKWANKEKLKIYLEKKNKDKSTICAGDDVVKSYHVVFAERAADAPSTPFSINVLSDALIATSDGKGMISIQVSSKSPVNTVDKYFLGVFGADVTSTTINGMNISGPLTVTPIREGEYKLALENLLSGGTVRLSVRDKTSKDVSAVITRPIVRAK